LGQALLQKGDASGAAKALETAANLEPANGRTLFELGEALMQKGAARDALTQWEKARQLSPENPAPLNSLAWALATSSDASLRDGRRALELAREAVRLSAERDPATLDTLAAAQAECGQFSEAME